MAKKNVAPPSMKRLVLLKLKLKSLLAKLPQPREAKRAASGALSMLLLLSSIGYVAVKAPEMHDAFLRYKVGSRVYMIKNTPNGGGGTGFAIKGLKTGQTYIVTNSHVCDHIMRDSQDGTVLVMGAEGAMRRRVIEVSDKSDLCLIEDLPGVEGLSVGGEPSIGQAIKVVGHPRLRPLSISHGDIVGEQDVDIISYILPTGDPMADSMIGQQIPIKDAKCDLPKNELREVEVNFMGAPLKLKICLNVTRGAYMSTAVIFPGNSGSPVVDFWGNVIGVAFAADETNWGDIVSNDDLRELLARY